MSDVDTGQETDRPFDFETELQVRFRDIDSMHHVNNAVYASYLEQARAEYFRSVVGWRLHEVSSVLVSLEIEYRRPIELGDRVTVALRLGDLGESSIPMTYEIRTEAGVAATAETVQVAVDDAGEARPLPEEWREAIAAQRA